MSAHDLVVEADYGQFHLLRQGADHAGDEVTSEGYERHLWTNGSFVYVGTLRSFGATALRVEVLDAPPGDEVDASWQHVAEVSLGPGGAIEVHGWGSAGPVATVPAEPGSLRLRVHWRNLVAGRAEGLDEDGESDEQLLVLVWSSPAGGPEVLRWWPEWLLPAPTVTSPDGRRQVEGLEAVVDRLPALVHVAALAYPYPPMPGGEPAGSMHAVLRDPGDGSWWVDGYDVRRTLREVSEAEAREVIERYGC